MVLEGHNPNEKTYAHNNFGKRRMSKKKRGFQSQMHNRHIVKETLAIRTSRALAEAECHVPPAR